MICGHDLTSLIGVDGIDTSLGSAGAMTQKNLCQTMQICITIKKNEVALETAETASSACRSATSSRVNRDSNKLARQHRAHLVDASHGAGRRVAPNTCCCNKLASWPTRHT